MIKEWFWASISATSPAAKFLGYPLEVAQYRAKWERNKAAWQPHLEKCRKFILQACESTQKRDLAIVVGSGHCLDIPLIELSQRFKKVVLVDVVHPRRLAKAAARLGNVSTLIHDMTGALESVTKSIRNGEPLTLQSCGCDLFLRDPPDLVVSANILAQLPLIPVERLWMTGKYTNDDLDAIARQMIMTHLRWMDSLPGVRCLITDLTWLKVGRNEALSSFPLHGIPIPESKDHWEWHVAPAPEAHPHCDIIHIVGGILLLPQ